MTHHREQERERFTGTGFGDTDDVSTGHDCGDGLRLNGRGCGVPESFDDVVAVEC